MVSCRAYYVVYMTKEVSVIFLYSSKNDGGPHRNCCLTRVIRVAESFYIDLKGPHWSFHPRVASDNPFLWNLKCFTNYFVSF